MATREKKLNNFRNLEIISLIAYLIGLVVSVVRIRFFGLTISTFTFSDLVDAGYLDASMMIPYYLAIVATLIAILTVGKNEPYFQISAFFSAILPIITLFSLQGAMNKLENNLEFEDTFGLTTASYDLGAFVIVVGIIISFYAAIKFDAHDEPEITSTSGQQNAMLNSKYDSAKPIYPHQGPTPIQNLQSKVLDISEKKEYRSKFCSNCGNEIPDGNLFCVSCGVKVEE